MVRIAKPQGEFATEPIAIVGSSCRFPGGATSPSKLWELLLNPRDLVTEIPPTRFHTAGRHHPDSQHHGVSIQGVIFLKPLTYRTEHQHPIRVPAGRGPSGF